MKIQPLLNNFTCALALVCPGEKNLLSGFRHPGSAFE